MAHHRQAAQCPGHHGLAPGGVGALLSLQPGHGAVLDPGAGNRGEHAGGVPRGGADGAFQRRDQRGRCRDKAEAQAGGHVLGQAGDIHRALWRERGDGHQRVACQVGVGCVLDHQQVVLAGDHRQPPACARRHHAAQRVVQGGHGVDGAHGPGVAQALQGVEVGAFGAHGHGGQVQPQALGQHAKAGVGEGVHGDDVAGVEQAQRSNGHAVLRAVDDEHLLAGDLEQPRLQVTRHDGALVLAPAIGLVVQQRLQVARGRELAQRLAQLLGLPGHAGVVERQVDGAGLRRGEVRPRPWVRGVAHKGAAPGFAHHQADGFQFGIHAAGRAQREPVPSGQFTVRGQPGGRPQPAGADVGRECIDHLLVPNHTHGNPNVSMTIL